MPFYCFALAISLGIVAHTIFGFATAIFSDDAYYYSIIARNFAESGRFTFDGTNETNGFHPLLFWIQVVLSSAIDSDASALHFYRAVLVLSAFILLLFTGVFMFLSRRLTGTAHDHTCSYALLFPIAFSFSPRILNGLYCGMESTLALPLCAFTILFLHSSKYLSAGLVGALLVAARLDTFTYLVLPLSGVYACLEWHKRKSFSHALGTCLRILLPATAFVLILMVFNYVYFGHAMPIHGALRSTFPDVHVQLHNIFSRYALRSSISLLSVIGGGLLLLRPGQAKGRLRVLGWACVVVTLTQLLSYGLFQKWSKGIPMWYSALPLFTGVTSLAIGMANRLP